MHELSIAEQILHIVVEEAERLGDCQVLSAQIKVGRLMQVEVDGLLFCLDTMKDYWPQTAKTVFTVEEVPLELECEDCGQWTKTYEYRFACASCGSQKVELKSGDTIEVSSMEVSLDESESGEKCNASQQ
jgi:hydrogenase nickel incorporation protein HypA/HybF